MAGIAPIAVAGMSDGEFLVYDNPLYQLLTSPDFHNRPLVIVSIAGVCRSGKSFMMNIFIRYLTQRGWENENWFGENDSKIEGGDARCVTNFDWRKGSLACTQGIMICPKIFNIPLKDGREAAVLLVDTQGLHDDDASPDTNARIMSLSLLLSSHQILNVFRNIDTRVYSHMQLCVSLAKATARMSDVEGTSAFQDLTLLVRDFEHDEYPLGDNKKGYLRDKMENSSKSGTVEHVKTALKSAFDSMGCFVLPHPGKGVVKPGPEGVSNDDMDEEFRQYTKRFVESVFHREKLRAKAINGKELRAIDLLHVLGKVGQAYREGRAPTAETLYQSLVRGNHTKALSEAVSEYRKKMRDALDKTGVFDQEDLGAANSEALDATRNCFLSIANMGTQQEQQEYWDRCKTECQLAFNGFEQSNGLKKDRELLKIKMLRHKLGERFTVEMEKVDIGVTENVFNERLNELEKEILGEFDTETPTRIRTAVPEMQHLRQELEKQMKSAQMATKTKKERRKSQSMNALEQAVTDVQVEFNKECEKHAENYHSDLCDIQQKLKNEALAMYDKRTTTISETKEVTKYRTALEKSLEERCDQAIRTDREKKALLDQECEEAGNEYGEDFEKSLEETMVRAYIKQSCFDSWVDKYLLEKVTPSIKDKPEWAQQMIKKVFKEKVSVIKQGNQSNKGFRSVAIDRLAGLEENNSKASAIGKNIGTFFKGVYRGFVR